MKPKRKRNDLDPQEIRRRVRLGDIRKLLRHRYGPELPDDDAGREDLVELLIVESLRPTHQIDRMRNTVEVWAPWMSERECDEMIDNVIKLPMSKRMVTAAELGQRMNLKAAEREEIGCWSIRANDVDDDEREWLARERRNHKQRVRRRVQGVKPHSVHVKDRKDKAAERDRVCKKLGISVATYYRRGLHLPSENENGVKPLKVTVDASRQSHDGGTASPPQQPVHGRSADGAAHDKPARGGSAHATAKTACLTHGSAA